MNAPNQSPAQKQDQDQSRSANDLRQNTFVLGTMGGTTITAIILLLAIVVIAWWRHSSPSSGPGMQKTPARQDGKPQGTP